MSAHDDSPGGAGGRVHDGASAAGGCGTTGPNILVVEDEFFLAFSLEEDLRAGGCCVVGPFSDLARATEASRRERFDLALLDINLNGEMVFPLADELSARGIPFLFLTGYSGANLPERFRPLPRIAKPYDPATLVGAIRRMLPPGQ